MFCLSYIYQYIQNYTLIKIKDKNNAYYNPIKISLAKKPENNQE